MIFKKVAIGLTLSLSVIAPIITAAPSMAANTLSTPTGLKTVDQTSTSVGLSWNAVAGAPQYRIQYSSSADMSNSVYIRSIDNQANVDARDLAPNTTYYFKVRIIATDGTGMSGYTPALAVKTKAAVALPALTNTLSVATYNIHCANCNADPANSWVNRRDSVVATVKSKMPDVMGVQEASQAWLKDASGKAINLAQFEDFKNRLNTAGAPYEVTNSNRNNCVDSTRPTNCVYADKGASTSTRLFYNKNTVTLLSQGSVALPKLPTASEPKYVAWTTFKQNSTGKSFFVADGHLISGEGSELYELRKQQAIKITQVISEKNTSKLPVIITGDMNSSKWAMPTNAPYDEYMKAGYVDPVGGTWRTSLASGYATAETMKNAQYYSYSGFTPTLAKTSLTGPRALGSHIDYILTSKMRVASWEMVLNVDANGVFQGRIPSDHNMIVAKVGLPDASAPTVTPASPATTQSAIAVKAASLGGGLGAATSGEVYGLKNGGGYQNFEHGAIVWSPTTGARISMGAVRGLWLSAGAENGGMGYPTSDEILDGYGGVYQTFESGAIVYSPRIGATISFGAIRNLWLATGGVGGGMGYPTSNEILDGRGGVYQTYERGAIIYGPGYGTFVSFGAIRSMWLSTGGVNGRLGYPTSNEYVTSTGNVAQNYQGGIIRWGTQGNTIVYK